jgi:hypothetical protein
MAITINSFLILVLKYKVKNECKHYRGRNRRPYYSIGLAGSRF